MDIVASQASIFPPDATLFQRFSVAGREFFPLNACRGDLFPAFGNLRELPAI
jgi:hypothetical protein